MEDAPHPVASHATNSPAARPPAKDSTKLPVALSQSNARRPVAASIAIGEQHQRRAFVDQALCAQRRELSTRKMAGNRRDRGGVGRGDNGAEHRVDRPREPQRGPTAATAAGREHEQHRVDDDSATSSSGSRAARC